ncbi:nitrophenyl compound nitroreductase subunit ArsF family protein [Aquisphaera insulae]|uniref:nitrophenyl compound nitroreductase subunit ArsF family protein n=1 Tax=Aquisphaera insulae TaxID=2712864 RepID=UPI00196B90EB|nr:nitrophenyl compound nitroreductase subunit ArsF family protein [Aquisphaera insulae]
MTSKGLLTIALLGFVAVTVATLVFQETGAKGTATTEPSATATATGAKLMAYYLHGKVRCVTCNDIEKTAREAVEAGFAEDLRSGRIEWRAVDYDEPGNEHFASDFRLSAPSVVLATLRDGRQTSWKSLPEVWELIADRPKLRAFIERNVREQLSGVTAQDTAPAQVAAPAPAASVTSGRLPRLLDLGAGRCIPCKEMAPILEELRETYRGRLDVVFLDVGKDPDAASRYEVSTIPTQIFFDAAGKERSRHEGFLSRADILARWRELGVELERADRSHDGSPP